MTGNSEVITIHKQGSDQHRNYTLPKPIPKRQAQTLGFSASVSRNLGLPERLGFGKVRSGASQFPNCRLYAKLVQNRPELINQPIVNDPVHQPVQMHELELPVMVTLLFCKPPYHHRFYVRIRMTITDEDSDALIDFNSNLERSEWNLIHLLELIS